MIDEKLARATLDSLHTELQSRLVRIDAHQHHREQPLDPDFEEQANETQNDEVVAELDDVSRRLLQDVQRALARLDAGEYGTCASCGGEIGEQRLLALPYTELCIHCAERS